MPEVLTDGLPEPMSRSRFDFSAWADGRAWKFVKGEDYQSTTESFRYNVKRWAKAHGFQVEARPYAATDDDGTPLPATKADPVALGVRFSQADGNGAGVRLRAGADEDDDDRRSAVRSSGRAERSSS